VQSERGATGTRRNAVHNLSKRTAAGRCQRMPHISHSMLRSALVRLSCSIYARATCIAGPKSVAPETYPSISLLRVPRVMKSPRDSFKLESALTRPLQRRSAAMRPTKNAASPCGCCRHQTPCCRRRRPRPWGAHCTWNSPARRRNRGRSEAAGAPVAPWPDPLGKHLPSTATDRSCKRTSRGWAVQGRPPA